MEELEVKRVAPTAVASSHLEQQTPDVGISPTLCVFTKVGQAVKEARGSLRYSLLN